MTDSVQRQLAMPGLTDSEMLDRLIACILSAPCGLERIARVRDSMIDDGVYPRHPDTNTQVVAFTAAPLIRARLEESRDRMRGELGCNQMELAVIRNWYGRNYELIAGDLQFVSEDTSRKEPRWHRTFSNAIKGCNVLQRVDQNRYLIV